MRYRLFAMTVAVSMLQLFGANLLGVRVSAQGDQAKPARDSDPPPAIRRIAKEQGLHEAARANGGTYAINFPMATAWRGQPRNVEQLVDSPLIVVGAIQAGESRTRIANPMIDTIYSVLVSETVKGDARSVVKVSVPGGRLTFADGTVAEVRTPGFALQTGDTYVLFLRPEPNDGGTAPTDIAEGVQLLCYGSLGVVHISTGRARFATVTPRNELRAQQDGRDAAEFLNEVRALAHRGR